MREQLLREFQTRVIEARRILDGLTLAAGRDDNAVSIAASRKAIAESRELLQEPGLVSRRPARE